MHLEAYMAILGMKYLVDKIERPNKIVEVGSREVSGGGVRQLFLPNLFHIGIDLVKGPGVNVVGDFLNFWPVDKPDCVICCEVLEHHPRPEMIVKHAYDILDKDGWAMFTFAGPNRPPHGAEGKDLPEGEHYRNISREEAGWMFKSAGFGEVSVDYPKPRNPHTSFVLNFTPEQQEIINSTVADIDTYVLARKTWHQAFEA